MRVVARLVAATVLLVVSGCGNLVGDVTSAGTTGVAVDADGSVTVVLFVCGEDITTVDVSRDREGLAETEENPVVATFTAEGPLDGLVRLDLSAPDATWTPQEPVTLEAGKGYLISAGGTAKESGETEQVYVKNDDLTEMRPGGVYVTPRGEDLVRLTESQFTADGRSVCGTA